MEEVIAKREVPRMPASIRIQGAAYGSCSRREIEDLSEKGVREIAENIRTGKRRSLMLTPDEYGEEGYLMMESSSDLIFLQIWDAESNTAWACFDPAYLESNEEAPIECSNGQSVVQMKTTMRDRELAAECVEWYIHTLEPYPGMDWLKLAW